MADTSAFELRRIRNEISSLQEATVQVHSAISGVANRQQQTEDILRQLQQDFAEYVRADELARKLQLAETRLVKVRQELDTQFGHYAEVRRRAPGMIQAFDAGLVTHNTIQETTEDVMLKAPGYWLAPALVALAAWARNDEALARKAIPEATARDSDKTALFMALILRRYARWGASARWIDFFFQRQDPLRLRRDFVVVLEGIAYGAFGSSAKATAGERIHEWINESAQSDHYDAEQTDRWSKALGVLTPSNLDHDYHLLRSHATNWTDLENSMRNVSVHGQIREHFSSIFSGGLETPRGLDERIDAIIVTLVSSFDAEELPLRREESRLDAIIKHDGNEQAATGLIEESAKALDDHVSIGELLTNAAMRPEESGASRGSQRLATAMSKEWIIKAHDELTASIRAGQPQEAQLSIEGWSGKVSQSGETDQLEPNLKSKMDRDIASALAAVKFEPKHYVAMALVVLCLIWVFSWPPAIIAVGALIFWLWREHSAFDKRRKAIAEEGKTRKASAIEILRGSGAEFRDYTERWSTLDAEAEEARGLLERIDPIQFSLSDATREIL